MTDRDKQSQFNDDVEIVATRASRPWSRRAQLVAIIGWSSFLIASIAAVLFFAFVDPGEMEAAMSGRSFSQMTGYAIGFFFFWLLAAGSALFTVFMLRTSRKNPSDYE